MKLQFVFVVTMLLVITVIISALILCAIRSKGTGSRIADCGYVRHTNCPCVPGGLVELQSG